ncbi:cobyrinate a,c-diamide synthase [Micromonospora sp. WMMD1102]|uniref:cobyrinate a,c-diamide synthase n=1 Tax=Micromonospora sp. WMMD1102 TaxID=3016105 RepID=UPI0024151A7F|nr:cobyrinate a,c-diamide synthase [Micromonospora sp. WMMD1102]MDG4789414.1 cobyrinate a,c-diamide synthase [Micromonospora sp. WMMD1102]
MIAAPRLVVSAPSSGHGKTAIAVGLLAALAARGLDAAGFKVGPDHTDAAYLGLAAGRPGRNLDPRLVGAQRIAPLFAHGSGDAEIAVVEGTMGLFDSLAGRPEVDSTAAIATTLRAPVVLVVDVGSMGQSVAALAHGFRAYDEMLWLGGVILNRVASDRHEQLLRDALDDIGVPVFGALRRRDLPAVLPSRQHGVVPVMQRGVEAYRGVRRLGEAIAGAVDLDRLMALARSAPRVPVTAWSAAEALAELGPVDEAPAKNTVVALAGGPALSYSYAETAELLAAAGAEVVTFDPLRDETLPAEAGALTIGGGLPETYAEELSANRRLCIAVAELARTGRPVIAEGAGLLWLAREFDGHPMCGVLDAAGASLDRIVVGYREATAQADTPVARLGARVVGYKQHRGVLTPRAGQTPAWSWGGGPPEGFVWRRVHASQLTLHWASSPVIASRLVAAAAAAASTPAPATPTSGAPATPTSGAPATPTSGAPATPTSGAPAGPTSGAPAAPTSGAPAAPASGAPAGPPSGAPDGLGAPLSGASVAPVPPASVSPAGPASVSPAPPGVAAGPPAGHRPAGPAGAPPVSNGGAPQGAASRPPAGPPRPAAGLPGSGPAPQPGTRPAGLPGSGPAPQPGTRPAGLPGSGPAPQPGPRPAGTSGAGSAPRPRLVPADEQMAPGGAADRPVRPADGPDGAGAASPAGRAEAEPAAQGARPAGPGGAERVATSERVAGAAPTSPAGGPVG